MSRATLIVPARFKAYARSQIACRRYQVSAPPPKALSSRIAAHYSLDQVRNMVIHEAKSASEKPGKIILWPNGVRAL